MIDNLCTVWTGNNSEIKHDFHLSFFGGLCYNQGNNRHIGLGYEQVKVIFTTGTYKRYAMPRVGLIIWISFYGFLLRGIKHIVRFPDIAVFGVHDVSPPYSII